MVAVFLEIEGVELLCGRRIIGDAFDFDLAVDDHAGDDAGAGGRMLTEILFEDGIERREIARVVEPYATAHDVLGPVPGFAQNGEQVFDCLMRLHDNVACDQLAVSHGHLARNI